VVWGSIPFVFMTIYTLAFGRSGKIPPTRMLVIDRDDSIASQFFARGLSYGKIQEFLRTSPAENLDEARRAFEHNQASAALVIPEGFGRALIRQEPTTLELYTNPRHFYGPRVAEGVMGVSLTLANGLLRTFSEPLALIRTYMEREEEPGEEGVARISKLFYEKMEGGGVFSRLGKVKTEIRSPEKAEFNMAAYFFPGLVVLSLLTLALSIEMKFLRDRLEGLDRRILASPRGATYLVLSQRAYAVTFLYFVAVVIALLGGAIWHLPPVGLFEANLLTLATIFFVAGLNGAIFALSRTRRGAAALSSVMLTFLIMLGGGTVPVEFFPTGIRKISHLTPVGLANTGIVESVTGRPLSVSPPMVMLYGLAFLVLGSALGIRRARKG